MAWDGMLGPEGGVLCNECCKPLNPNGHRPAELYAGTYTGICYSCQNKPARCVKVELLDRAEHWDFPPHCPSWRRDRESYIGYRDCNNCDGRGAKWVSRPDPQGGSYRAHCKTCFSRYYDYPVRKRLSERRMRIHNAWMSAFVNHLLSSRLASRRKRKSREDGVKLKDHLGKTIWIYCPKSMLNPVIQRFMERGSVAVNRHCSFC